MSARDDRRCRLGRDLAPYVDRELDVDATLRFEAHLPSCPDCARAVATQRRLDDLLQTLPQPRSVGPERDRLRAVIAARTANPPAADARPTASRLRPLRRLAAAAAIVLLAGAAAWQLMDREEAERDTAPPEVASAPPVVNDAAEPPAPTSPFATPPPEPLLSAPSDEVAAILRRLGQRHAAAEGGDLLTNFLIAAKPIAERGADLTAVLGGLLHDPDADLAARAALLLAEATRSGMLRHDAPGLVAGLERALHRQDRGPAMIHALERIGTRQAWTAIVRAAALPSLRERALLAMAASGRRDLQEPLQRALVEELRARGDGRARAARIVAALDLGSDAALATLARAAAAGLPEPDVRAALARDAARALPLLATALRGDDDAARSSAIELAPCGDPAALAAPLMAAALVPDHSAAALTALRRLGGPTALVALAEWRAAAGFALAGRPEELQLQELAQRSFSAIADALAAPPEASGGDHVPDGLALAVAAVALRELAVAAAFAELVLDSDGRGGPRLRAALFDHVLTPTGLQARAALRLAREGATVPRERVLIHLRRAATEGAEAVAADSRSPRATEDAGRIAALLVLLYAEQRETALREGMAALDWSTTPSRIARVAEAARRILHERSLERSLERLPTLSALGP